MLRVGSAGRGHPCGGIPYILTTNRPGCWSRATNHEALAAAALRLLRDPELTARLTGTHSASRALRLAQVRDRWMNIYRELAMDQ